MGGLRVDAHRPAIKFSFNDVNSQIAALHNKISRGGNAGKELRGDYLGLAKLYSKKGDHDNAIHYALTARNTLVFEGLTDQERKVLDEANFVVADSLQSKAQKASSNTAKELYAKAFAKLYDESQGTSGPLRKEYSPKLLKLLKEYQSRFPGSNIDKELPRFCKRKEGSETVTQLIEKAKPFDPFAPIRTFAEQASNKLQEILPKPPNKSSANTSRYSERGKQFSDHYKQTGI